jgi:dCMP deaminase
MILGVSGLYASGKGEVVTYLEERSFYSYSLSDVIRQELAAKDLEETRERMIEAGNALREGEGAGALATRLLPKLRPDRNYVIDSIRHPAEVQVLRSSGRSFRLIWVEAQESLRLERIKQRGRSGDPGTLRDLRALEGRELASEDPSAQQLLAVRELADEVVHNDGAIESLHTALQGLLKKRLYFERPGWDEYFMNIARVVASRSNCIKRKVAAVITVDRRIIATGYNGTPRGTQNCNEGGCPRCNSFAPGGTDLGECLCSHAEENAITQSAFHGVCGRQASR